MAKTKILYIITKSNLGGAQRYVLDLATHLPKDHFDIAVVLGGQGPLKTKLVEAGIRVLGLKSLQRDVNVLSDLRSFFELVDILKNEQPRVIHLNSSKAAGLGVVASVLINALNILTGRPTIKTIFTVHGFAFNEERSWLAKKIIAFLHWLTIILADKTITVSEATKKQIRSWPLADSKLATVHNGIKQTDFMNQVNARRALLPTETRKVWIGTIAELHTNKGLDYLIEGFALVAENNPEIILIIIGEGEARAKLEQKISAHKLESRIKLLGFIDQASQYLKAFDIFALTSRTESLPYVLLEAGLAKLPVMATDVGGISEIIINQKTGLLIPARDYRVIASGLEFLLSHRQNHQLGESLNRHVLDNFSVDNMIISTIKIYEVSVKI